MNELLARQRGKLTGRIRAGSQGDERLSVEDLSDHGRSLQRDALRTVQLIDPGADERGCGRWHRELGEVTGRHPGLVSKDDPPLLHEHRERLLGEQRVALGRLHDPVADRWVDPIDRQQVGDERTEIGGGQGLERDRGGVQLPATPPGTHLQQLRPRHARHEDRRVDRPVGDVLDELEHRGLRPLHVVDDERDRSRPRHALEQPADSPERLLADRLPTLEPHDLCDLPRDPFRLVIAGDQSGDLREGCRRVLGARERSSRPDRLDDRPERDAVAVW